MSKEKILNDLQKIAENINNFGLDKNAKKIKEISKISEQIKKTKGIK